MIKRLNQRNKNGGWASVWEVLLIFLGFVGTTIDELRYRIGTADKRRGGSNRPRGNHANEAHDAREA